MSLTISKGCGVLHTCSSLVYHYQIRGGGAGNIQVSGIIPNQLQNSSDHALLSTKLRSFKESEYQSHGPDTPRKRVDVLGYKEERAHFKDVQLSDFPYIRVGIEGGCEKIRQGLSIHLRAPIVTSTGES